MLGALHGGGGLNYAYVNARADGEIQVNADNVAVVQHNFPEWGVCNAIKFTGQFPGSVKGYTQTIEAGGPSFEAVAAHLLVNGVPFHQSSAFTGNKKSIWIWYSNSATEWYYMLYSWSNIAERTVVTVKAGCPLYDDSGDRGNVFAVTTEDVSFRFENGEWIAGIPAESIAFTATQDYVEIGETLDLGATFLPVGSKGTFTFTSSDETKATVDEHGVVTGVAAGEVTVTASCTGLTAQTYTLDVVESVTKSALTVITGKTQTLEPYEDYVLPTAEWQMTANGKTYRSQPFTVDAANISGTFNNGKAGTYTLTVTMEGKSDTFAATVKEFTEITWSEQLSAQECAGSSTDMTISSNNQTYGFPFEVGDPNVDSYTNDAHRVKIYRGTEAVARSSHIRAGNTIIKWYFLANGTYAGFKPNADLREGDRMVVEKGFRLTRPANGDDPGEIFASAGFTWIFHNGVFVKYVGEPTAVTVIKPEGVAGDIYQDIPVQLTATFAPENTLGVATWTSSDESVATVDQTGKVVGVQAGTVEITATYVTLDATPQTLTDTVTFTVKDHGPMVGVSIVAPYTVYVPKDGTVTALTGTWKAKAVYEPATGVRLEGKEFDLTLGENFILPATQPTGTVGKAQWDVTVKVPTADGTTDQTGKLDVMVYEYYDQEISSVNVLDPAQWGGWGFGMLVAFGNTSSNTVDIVDMQFEDIAEKITYKRADGTDVEFNLFGVLSGHIGIRPAFADDPDITISNLDQYYREGDVLTFKQGMPMYKRSNGATYVEGFLKEDTVYIYKNAMWNFFKDYTGITAAKPALTVTIGKSIPSGVNKVPVNASEGLITYTTSKPEVAVVSASGLVRGVAAGEVTITATITDLNDPDREAMSVTVTVTVVDEITGIVFEPESITVAPGAEVGLSGVKAYYKWASGKKGDEVDLGTATVTGFDPEKAEEQSVTVKVTVDGTTYSGKLKVTVGETNKKGCGCKSSMEAGVTATLAGVVLLLAVGLVLRRKGKAE